MNPIIYWFRQDLRLSDNRALKAAHASGHPVLPVFILDDASPGAWRHGGASRWWLHHSIASLQQQIQHAGGTLCLRRGVAVDELIALVERTPAAGIYFSRCYEPWAIEQEQALHQRLPQHVVKRFSGSLLFEPEALRTGAGQPFRVFSPMWKAACRLPEPVADGPLEDPHWMELSVPGDRLDEWQLRPTQPDWAGGFTTWRPGEAGATTALNDFLSESAEGYKDGRDRPDLVATSRLSPHLRFGEIAPRRIWAETRATIASTGRLETDAWAFLRELGWRDFSYQLLVQFPALPSQPFRPQYKQFPWQDDESALGAWQRGQTGYPLIDAGMRELWSTGWMHNRVRMIAASFLVKHLLIPWQRGAEWFWDTLVDADLANNSASWQWVAGCGADAAPYFRIFNPIIQGQKFDPKGNYVRHWVPELARLPSKVIHQPWAAPEQVLQEAGVALGRDYPKPIVEHSFARQRALGALAQMKRKT